MNGVRVTVRVAPVFCWSCGAEYHIVPSVRLATGDCHVECSVVDFTAFPRLAREINARLPAHLETGIIKPRFSRTWGREYMSNGCYHCDALQGQHYEIHARYDEFAAAEFEGAASDEWLALITALEASEDGHLI